MRLGTPLPCNEDGDAKHAGQDGREGCCRCPRMLRTAPGDAKQETGGAANKQECAEPVHAPRAIGRRQVDVVDEEQRSKEAYEAEREIDIEAPAPGGFLDERTTDHRPDNAANGPRGEYHGEVLGPLPQGDHVTEDDLGHGDDAPASYALHAAPDEHDGEVVRNCAEGRAEGEEDDGDDEQPPATIASGRCCDHGLEYGRGEEVGGARPKGLSGRATERVGHLLHWVRQR